MKDFIKFTLATVVGIIISSVVLFLIAIGMVAGMMSLDEGETIVSDNSVFCLDLDGVVAERAIDDPLSFFGVDDAMQTYGLDDITSSIKKAAKEAEKARKRKD